MRDKDTAGAVFDFAGFLTTRKKVISVGASEDAAPMADLVQEFLKKRGFDDKYTADVGGWSDQ